MLQLDKYGGVGDLQGAAVGVHAEVGQAHLGDGAVELAAEGTGTHPDAVTDGERPVQQRQPGEQVRQGLLRGDTREHPGERAPDEQVLHGHREQTQTDRQRQQVTAGQCDRVDRRPGGGPGLIRASRIHRRFMGSVDRRCCLTRSLAVLLLSAAQQRIAGYDAYEALGVALATSAALALAVRLVFGWLATAGSGGAGPTRC